MAKKLYVGNLPYTIQDQDLEDLFAQYGNVVSANVIMDRTTGRSKGFGFVEMQEDNDAEGAIHALDGKEFEGRTLTVSEAKPRTDRPGTGRGPRRY